MKYETFDDWYESLPDEDKGLGVHALAMSAYKLGQVHGVNEAMDTVKKHTDMIEKVWFCQPQAF